MANSRIDIIGAGEVPLVTELYNGIFKPARDEAFIRRRILGRHNALLMVAHVEDRPVGFFMGFELKPEVYFEWLYGVLPEFRRSGVGAQLMDASHAWIVDHGYHAIRMECQNQHRPMLHMAISRGYDIAGIRWDPERHANLVICEKHLAEE